MLREKAFYLQMGFVCGYKNRKDEDSLVTHIFTLFGQIIDEIVKKQNKKKLHTKLQSSVISAAG